MSFELLPASDNQFMEKIQSWDPHSCEDECRVQTISHLAHHAKLYPAHADRAVDTLAHWANTLTWTANTLFYRHCHDELRAHMSPAFEQYLAQQPGQHFRFELMAALHSEMTNTTYTFNDTAVKMGLPKMSPLQECLERWSDSTPGLLIVAPILDQLIPRPDIQAAATPDEAKIYKAAMFNLLNQAYLNCHQRPATMVLPSEWEDPLLSP